MYIMRSSISRWGNSLAVRLPKAAVDAAGLCEGDPVEITEDDGGLRITRRNDLDIAALIDAITPENLNVERAWIDAPPAGKELL